MNPVKQTLRGGPADPAEEHGDCFRACVCSLLGLPIEAFDNPSPALPHDEWERLWVEQLIGHGYWMTGINVEEWDEDEPRWWISPGYWIASVRSRNIDGVDENGRPITHAVVMKGAELAHDPQTVNPYPAVPIEDVLGVRWLVSVDPEALRARGGSV